jgi:hypothetical protein
MSSDVGFIHKSKKCRLDIIDTIFIIVKNIKGVFMKKCILIVLIVVLYFSAVNVFAAESRTGINIGLKTGAFSLSDVHSLNIFSIGGVVGYTLPFENPYFEVTLEGDFNLGIFGGSHVTGNPDNQSRIRTFGTYGVVSSIPSKDIYFKGKIGITHETEFEKLFDYEEETIDRSIGPSFGVGVGYRAAGNVNLELEFTTTNSDMKFFSLALRFLF